MNYTLICGTLSGNRLTPKMNIAAVFFLKKNKEWRKNRGVQKIVILSIPIFIQSTKSGIENYKNIENSMVITQKNCQKNFKMKEDKSYKNQYFYYGTVRFYFVFSQKRNSTKLFEAVPRDELCVI